LPLLFIPLMKILLRKLKKRPSLGFPMKFLKILLLIIPMLISKGSLALISEDLKACLSHPSLMDYLTHLTLEHNGEVKFTPSEINKNVDHAGPLELLKHFQIDLL